MDTPAVMETIAKSYTDAGRAIYESYYFMLVRVGDNYRDYPFEWEPFRDLAGIIGQPENATPIVIISQAPGVTSPLVTLQSSPKAHVVITIAPTVPLVAIVDTWVRQLIDQRVPAPEQAAWFLAGLKLTPSDVSPETAAFLLGTPAAEPPPSPSGPTLELSASVRGAADGLGTGDVTAWAIAAAVVANHDEYAIERLVGLDFTGPEDARRAPWFQWRDDVVALFDPVAVPDSRHQVVDGRLMIVGLCILEPALRVSLEEKDAWVPLLLEIDEAAAPPDSELYRLLEDVGFAHGYQSDRASGADQLGIDGEVNALCAVLLDSAVKPPVSVGLFGEWGSGKTFFMDMMRSRIRQVTSSPVAGQVADVVQIRFNAWHYSDSSLWASLATEIFDRLADPEPVDPVEQENWLKRHGDPNVEVRTGLLTELETYRSAKAALEAQSQELVARRTEVEARRRRALARQAAAVRTTNVVDVVTATLADEQVRAGLAEVKAELGVEPSIEELRSLSRELAGTSGYLLATWRRIKHKTVASLLVVVGVVLLVIAAALIVRGADLLAPAVAALGTLGAAVATVRGYVRPAVERVDKALTVVSSALGSAEAAEARARKQHDDALRRLDVKLAEADRDIAEASAAAAALTNQIAATEAEASKLTVGRQLFDFLAERSAGYQRHMGVVGLLHRDFVFLDAQIRALADPETDDAGPALASLPRIDRVILYIDDLDRCRPEKVLEVLEAVHLLLALELFVVVVGVDPRWLRRSLRYQYRHLVTKAEGSSDAYLTMMPIQYLEKIFQIPLTLARMNPKGFAKLVAGLAPTTTTTSPPPPPVSPPPTTTPVTDGTAPTRSVITAQPGSAAAGPPGSRSLDITPAELQFVQSLGELVSSPRAAKRLMNTYRLIRSTQQLGSRSRFLGSDGRPASYQAVLLLLGIASGYPLAADRVLGLLEHRASPAGITTWTAFVAALNPAVDDKGAVVGVLVPDEVRFGYRRDAEDEESVAVTWARLYTALTKLPRPAGALDDLAQFQKWGPTVARFSFQL